MVAGSKQRRFTDVSWAEIGALDVICVAEVREMVQCRISRTLSAEKRTRLSGVWLGVAETREVGSMARSRIPRAWPLRMCSLFAVSRSQTMIVASAEPEIRIGVLEIVVQRRHFTKSECPV